MLKKVIYYKFYELDLEYGLPSFAEPYSVNSTFEQYLDEILTDYSGLTVDVSNTKVDNLWKSVISKYYYHAIVRMELPFDTPDSYLQSTEYVNNLRIEYKKWIWKFLALLEDTADYYLNLLSYYDSARESLMADIKAISKNKVKFNDTPQNPNTDDVYEGDNYITHFTATEGETSSPLMSKMMRLKEIQENYRSLMSQWIRDFERVFYQQEVE